MTVIAYDGKSIAADRQASTTDTIYGYQTKLMKWSGGVWTSAGRLTDHVQFAKWLEDRDVHWKPFKDFGGLFTENGVVWEIDAQLQPYVAFVPSGLGDGGAAAVTLMHVGYTAKQACLEVCKHNVYCGGKVDSVDV